MAVWRRAELKSGVCDEIVSARLDRQLAALGAAFGVHRTALKASEPKNREPENPSRLKIMYVGHRFSGASRHG
jgi:hypothetical protein